MPLSKKLNYNQSDSDKSAINAVIIDSIILPYLCGHSVDAVKNAFITPNGTHITKKHFRSCPIHKDLNQSPIDYEKRALRILNALGITNKSDQNKYLDKNKCNNVYQLLCHLYRDGHRHVDTLLNIIDDAKSESHLFNWLIPTFAMGLLTSAGLYLEYNNNAVFNKITNFFYTLGQKALTITKHITNGIRALTLICMGYHLLILAAEAIGTWLDNKRNLQRKIYDLSFAGTATALTLLSYAITYFTYGTMTVTAGSIFVAASFVSVIKHSISLYQAHNNYKIYANQTSEEIGKLQPIDKALYYRKLFEYRAERTALIQELAVAFVSTLIIASWSLALFFPPGLILVAASLSALIAVQSLHSYVSQKVKLYYDNELQTKLRNIAGLNEAIQNTTEHQLDDCASQIEMTTLKKMVLSSEAKPTPVEAIKSNEDMQTQPATLLSNAKSLFFQPEEMAQAKDDGLAPQAYAQRKCDDDLYADTCNTI